MIQYFEYINPEENSSKFWQIELEGNKIKIQFGRIGIKKHQIKIKDFKTNEEAKKYFDDVIIKKTNKGYQRKEK